MQEKELRLIWCIAKASHLLFISIFWASVLDRVGEFFDRVSPYRFFVYRRATLRP